MVGTPGPKILHGAIATVDGALDSVACTRELAGLTGTSAVGRSDAPVTAMKGTGDRIGEACGSTEAKDGCLQGIHRRDGRVG